MKLSLGDIVVLAKQGFTAKDVKELMNTEIIESEQQDADVPSENVSEENTQHDEVNEQPALEDDESIDYKKLYEESVEQLNKTTEDLKKAQNTNINQNINTNTQTDEEIISDLVRGFM